MFPVNASRGVLTGTFHLGQEPSDIRQHNRRVLLCCDLGQRLQITQLQRRLLAITRPTSANLLAACALLSQEWPWRAFRALPQPAAPSLAALWLAYR